MLSGSLDVFPPPAGVAVALGLLLVGALWLSPWRFRRFTDDREGVLSLAFFPLEMDIFATPALIVLADEPLPPGDFGLTGRWTFHLRL